MDGNPTQLDLDLLLAEADSMTSQNNTRALITFSTNLPGSMMLRGEVGGENYERILQFNWAFMEFRPLGEGPVGSSHAYTTHKALPITVDVRGSHEVTVRYEDGDGFKTLQETMDLATGEIRLR